MKHPLTRSQRRHNGEVWRERQRYIMKYCWFSRSRPNWFLDNNMWRARKQSVAHGSRCACHYEKYSTKEIAKRRRALDKQIIDNLKSWDASIAQ